MDSNNPISVFVVMITLYVFTLTLSILALGEWNTVFTVLSFIGLVVGFAVSLILGLALRKEGSSVAIFYLVYAGLTQVTLVWFTTRFGNHLGFL